MMLKVGSSQKQLLSHRYKAVEKFLPVKLRAINECLKGWAYSFRRVNERVSSAY